MGVAQILVDFTGWTSCHGLPHIGSASNWCLRTFWILIFCVSAAFFSWQFSLLYTKYTRYPVSVGTSLKFKELTFPAVTLCNLNPIKGTMAVTDSSVAGLMFNYNQAVMSNSTNIDPIFGFQGSDNIALQSQAKEDLVFLTGQGNFANMQFDLSDFVVNCAYNTKACDLTNDFKPKYDPHFGNCFQFNMNASYKSNRAGPIYGLRVLLKSNQTEYLPIIESAGGRIAIHSQDQEPFVDAFGYSAATGFTTSFGIQYVSTSRLSQPYGNCTFDKAGFPYNYGGVYTAEGCFRSCYQKQVEAKCSCSDPRYLSSSGSTTGSKFCPLNFPCLKNNFMNSSNDFNPISSCSCPQPCTESSYAVTVSNALWPSQSFVPQECQQTPSGPSWANQAECHDWYSNNTLLIEVYYERMNFQELSESASYTLVQLISDLGGQLGLWLGLSAITVVEVCSLIVLLIMYGCRNCKKPKNKQAVQDSKGPIPMNKKPPAYSEADKYDKADPTLPPPPAVANCEPTEERKNVDNKEIFSSLLQ